MSTSPCSPIDRAVAAIELARDHLARYSRETDWPELGVVDAADLIDAAHVALTKGTP